MISTSSSECECIENFGFGTALPNILGNPFGHTTRQPLIYYAKIEEPYSKPNVKKRKDTSSRFMKAFQWYTQELGSGHEKARPSNGTGNGFAAWLDEKYNEYVKESHREGSNSMFKHMPTQDSNGISKKSPRNKFGRMRSPWRRRRRPNSKENCLSNNPKQSIQYILLPQDMSKPVSEYLTRTSRMQSSTTIVSKESQKGTNINVISKSLLSIYQARHDHDTKDITKSKINKVLCECQNRNAGTQYATDSLDTFATPYHYKTLGEQHGKNEWRLTETEEPKKAPCECPESELYQNNDFHKECQENQILAQEPDSRMSTTAVIFNDSKKPSETQNLSIQTSDHSINLTPILCEQPIFLRVVNIGK